MYIKGGHAAHDTSDVDIFRLLVLLAGHEVSIAEMHSMRVIRMWVSWE
jgi:hypothetical protein